jgi:hypothetical protein
LEVLAGHAARGPWSVWNNVVPFERLAWALFWRRRTWGDPFTSAGGDPALAERAGARVVFAAVLVAEVFFGFGMRGVGSSQAELWAGRRSSISWHSTQ